MFAFGLQPWDKCQYHSICFEEMFKRVMIKRGGSLHPTRRVPPRSKGFHHRRLQSVYLARELKFVSAWIWHDRSTEEEDTGCVEFDVLSNNSSSLRKKCDRVFFLLTPCIPSALTIKVFSGKCCGDKTLLKRKETRPYIVSKFITSWMEC